MQAAGPAKKLRIYDMFSRMADFARRRWYLGLLIPAALVAICAWRISGCLYLEDDMTVMLPKALQVVETHSGREILTYILDNHKENAVPCLKIALMLLAALFGPHVAYYLTVTLTLHVLISLCLACLCRLLLQYSRFQAFMCGALLITCAALFHSWLWPVAMQHQITVLSILVYLLVYASAVSKNDYSFRQIAFLALTGFIISWTRISVLIGPLAVLTNVFLQAKTRQEFWAGIKLVGPATLSFVPALLYFIIAGTQGGIMKSFLLLLKTMTAFGAVLVVLLMVAFFCILTCLKNLRLQKIIYLTVMALGAVVLMSHWKWAAPFLFAQSESSALLFLLFPGMALHCDSLYGRWHAIGVNAAGLFGGAFLLFILVYFCVRRKPALYAWLIPWVLLPQIHTASIIYEAPRVLPSRYFLYLAIPVTVILAGLIPAPSSLRPWKFQIGQLYVLCLVTVLAANIYYLDIILRGTRLAAVWWSYDYATYAAQKTPGKYTDNMEWWFVNESFITEQTGIYPFDLGPYHPRLLVAQDHANLTAQPATGPQILMSFFPYCHNEEEISALCGGRSLKRVINCATAPWQFGFPEYEVRLDWLRALMLEHYRQYRDLNGPAGK